MHDVESPIFSGRQVVRVPESQSLGLPIVKIAEVEAVIGAGNEGGATFDCACS